MTDTSLLQDPRLLFVVVISAIVAMLGSLNVAARPAAVLTGRVAQATTISNIFFMISRFANMFYLPLMAGFVGAVQSSGDSTRLLHQVQWVVMGTALGALGSWILLPNFVSLFCFLVDKLDELGIKSFVRPSVLKGALLQFVRRYPLKARVGQLRGIPPAFLLFNVFATAVWTIGALSAVYCSGIFPQFKSTALLLSGLVNAFAAIAFSVCVDPQAALITDEAIKQQRTQEQVDAAALHLGLGNFLGALCGLAILPLGIQLISLATRAIGGQGSQVSTSIWSVVLINAALTLLASTTYASRVSAVITREIATALAVYNLFFLVSRLSGQIYSPLLGSTADSLVERQQVDQLEMLFRQVLGGASLGAFVGLLLLPTFVEVINKAVIHLQRLGSLPALLWNCLYPSSWPAILSCMRRPGLLEVRLSDIQRVPRTFLVGNVVVLSVHSVGMMAAIHAGAQLHEFPGAAGSATLLSSVVNGVATILLGLVVDPTLARLTDQCKSERRPAQDIKVAAVFLLAGMLLGTLFSQVLFTPASWLIQKCALALNAFLS